MSFAKSMTRLLGANIGRDSILDPMLDVKSKEDKSKPEDIRHGVKKKERRPSAFYINLTTWAGRRISIRYKPGTELTMEKFKQGGTYVYFSSGMVLVQESEAQILHKVSIKLKKQQELLNR